MMLATHRDETLDNKQKCQKLITRWARVIHGLNSNSSGYVDESVPNTIPKKRRLSVASIAKQEREERIRRLAPGEKGFIMRARVPQEVPIDFVSKPKSRIHEKDVMDADELSELHAGKHSKKATGAITSMKNKFKERMMSNARHKQHASTVNISGNFSGGSR